MLLLELFSGNLLFVAWNIEQQIHTDEYCRTIWLHGIFHASKEENASSMLIKRKYRELIAMRHGCLNS